MASFGSSLLHLFVCGLVRDIMLSTFKFDAILVMRFSTEILIDGLKFTKWIGTNILNFVIVSILSFEINARA